MSSSDVLTSDPSQLSEGVRPWTYWDRRVSSGLLPSVRRTGPTSGDKKGYSEQKSTGGRRAVLTLPVTPVTLLHPKGLLALRE